MAKEPHDPQPSPLPEPDIIRRPLTPDTGRQIQHGTDIPDDEQRSADDDDDDEDDDNGNGDGWGAHACAG